MTRRTFAGAGAATAVGAASAKPIRVAVHGIGHAHAFGKVTALRALPDFEFIGV